MKRSLSILSIIVVLALALSALAITSSRAGMVRALGLAVPAASENVIKTGVAGTVPGGGVGSQTINWTIDYNLTSTDPLQNLTLTDTWSAGQTLVPGSVNTPGGTWSFTQPDSTSINFTNALVAPGGKGAGMPIYVGLSGPVTFSGGGDGFNAALTTSRKLLGINHHVADAGIWCYDIVAEAICTGYETKMFPGINTNNNPFTRAIGNKIYIAGSNGVGGNTVAGKIYCWDTDTDSLCGTSPDIDAYDRLEISNGLLYTLLYSGEIDCYDPGNALARCAGYPVQVNVPAQGGTVGNGLLPVGDRLYVLNYFGDLNCLNTSTLNFCSGWSATPIDGTGTYDLLFPRLDAGGAVTGICQAGAGTAATCYDLNGANPVTVAGIATVTSGILSYASDSNYLGSRLWFAGYGNNVACWDWATGAVCTGSGLDANGRVTASLGMPYAVTDDNFCLYTFGDAGSLFSVDPVTGETPCTQSGGEVTVDIDAFYSNTNAGTVTANWDKIILTNVNLTQGVDFNSLQVWVTDPSDATVFGPTEMIGGSGIVDISSVSSSIRVLTLHIQASVVSGATGIDAKAWLTFDSNTPVQFTYQTSLTCSGFSQSASNTINTTLDPHTDTANVSVCGDATPTATVTPTSTVTGTSAVTSTPTVTKTATPTITTISTATKTATATRTPTATSTLAPVTVTINQAVGQTDPTNTRLLSFTAIFSEAVSGFTASDVTVGLNVVCAPTVTITGSGTTYNVALTGMNKECTATVSIPANSVNSISRPTAVNAASTSTDNSQSFQYVTKAYTSLGANDGWILESAAGSNVGGSVNNSATTMSVGDDSANRSYRMLSRFDTSADPIPTTAVITAANYRVTQSSITGTNPLTTHGSLRTFLNAPNFGASANLEAADYQSAADTGACIFDTTLLSGNAYRCLFFTVALPLLPKNGAFDLRSQFDADNANNAADLLNIHSGNATSMRPQLFIAYYLLP